jgi:hypothetical protein
MTSGVDAWIGHDGDELDARSDDDACVEAHAKLESAAAGLRRSDGYEVGQEIYLMVWRDGSLLDVLSHELTDEDLGTDFDATKQVRKPYPWFR